jgi:ABC-type transport system involved in cytochrome bd biosynthesis fused ATPase/permease subunit
VPQHPAFFRGSLRDNICYGRSEDDVLDLDGAIHASALEPVLAGLPQGIDAQMGDDGLMLSGGELQRIAIARALVHAPRVLLIDEPTNHLDAATVALLAERLFAGRGRTVLMATHDRRLLALADRVYDLAAGVLSCRTVPARDRIAS